MEESNAFLLGLGRVEGKIDVMLQTLQGHQDRMNRIDEDIENLRKDSEGRLRHIEMRMYTICTVMSALSPYILKLLNIG